MNRPAPPSFSPRHSLKVTLLLPLMVFSGLAGIAGGWLVHRTVSDELRTQILSRAEILANAINYAAETAFEPTQLQRQVAAIGAERDVNLILVAAGRPARIVASTRRPWLGLTLDALPNRHFAVELEGAIGKRRGFTELHGDTQELNIARALELNEPGITDGRLDQGAVLVYLDARPMRRALNLADALLGVWLATVLVTVGGLSYWLVTRWILLPAQAIAATMQRRASGDSGARTNATAADEIGSLARTLDNLLDTQDEAEHELARSYAALRESEQHLAILLHESPVGVFETDTLGRCVFVNERWSHISGLTLEQALGDAWADALHPNDRDSVFAEWNAAVQEKRPFTLEYRFRRPDGRIAWVFGQAVATIDEQGRPAGHIGTVTDITEQKRAEAALRESEAQFRALFRNAGMGIALVDMEGHSVHSNPALQRMLGYSGDELRGMVFTEFTHPDDTDKDMNLYRELMAGTRDSYRMEKRYYRKDGRLIHADLTVTLIRDAEGEPQFGIGMVEDITERKEAEESLKERNEILAALNNIADRVYRSLDLQTVAHEAVEAIMNYTGSPSVAFLRLNEEANLLELIHSHGFSEQALEKGSQLPLEGSLSGVTIACRQVITSDDMTSDGRLEPATQRELLKQGYKTAASIPLLFGERILGVANLVFREARVFTDLERDTLLAMGKTVGLAVANAIHVGQIEEEVTERERTENELQKERKFLKAVLNNIQDGIVGCDAEGTLTLFNRATEEFHGLPQEPLPPEKWAEHYDLYLADGKTPMRREDIPLFRALDGETVRNVEMVIAPKSGGSRILLASGQAFHDEHGTTLGAVVSMHDITEQKEAEHALHEQVRRNQKILQTTMDGYILADTAGALMDVNPAYCKMVGYTHEELLRMNIRDLEASLAPEQIDQRIETMIEQGSAYLKTKHRHKDGALIDLEVSIAIMESDTKPYVAAFLRDITEQQRAERALRESEERYRRIVETAEEGIWVIDAESNTSFVNRKMTDMLGYTEEEMLGKSLDMFMDIEAQAIAAENVERRRTGISEQHDFKFRRKDGTELWTLIQTNPITDDHGQYMGALAMVTDITARKATEEALARSKAEFESIFDSIPDAVIYADTERRIVMVNPAVTPIFGYSPQELLGRTTELLYANSPDYRKQGRQRYYVGAPRQSPLYEILYRRKNGSTFLAETLGTQVKDASGNALGFIGVIRDITERKQAEAELQAHRERLEELVQERTAELVAVNKELEAFSYSVSHDLRAPLRGIDGWSLALLEDYADKLEPTAREYLDRVRSEAQRMGELIDDLLTLSRIMRGEMRWQEVDLSAIAEKQAKALQELEADRKVEWHIQPGITAHGDPRLLSLVLQNLIGNAWKFTNRHDTARIDFGVTEKDGKRVFFLRDDGAGFGMAYAEKLFAPFQRLHRPVDFPGTGVGLAITLRIVQRHGGRIWAEAAVEQGATFYFTLGDS